MSKITLNNVASLVDSTTAANTINANMAVIQTAMDNTVSRDGTTPNTITATVDANGSRILNLPAPITSQEPLRLADLSTFVGGGTVSNIPVGGTSGQLLGKNSSTNFDVGWIGLSPTDIISGTNITTTGNNPTVIATTATPTFTTINTATIPTAVDTLVARNTTDTLTNKTFDTAATGNVFKINGLGITANTGTGSNVLATSPTITTPVISGHATIEGVTPTGATGTGNLVFATSPTFVTPNIDTATASSINGNTITTGTGTLTLGSKTLTASNSLTLAGTDATIMTFPATSSTVLTTGNTAALTVGYTFTPFNGGTISSGTFTPAGANGNYQFYTNNGAHTLAAPAADSAIDVMVTNGASAGVITFSGFTVNSNTGEPLTLTNTSKFIVSIRRINGTSTYTIKALQ